MPPPELFPSRTCFRELLELLEMECDRLFRECERCRSRQHIAGSDEGRESTGREVTLSSPPSAHPVRMLTRRNKPMDMLSARSMLGSPLAGARNKPGDFTPTSADGPADGGTKNISFPTRSDEAITDEEAESRRGTDNTAGGIGLLPTSKNAVTEIDVEIERGAKCESIGALGALGQPIVSTQSCVSRSAEQKQWGGRKSCSAVTDATNFSHSQTESHSVHSLFKRFQQGHGRGLRPTYALSDESVFVRLRGDPFFLNNVVDGVIAIVIVLNMLFVGISSELSDTPFVVRSIDACFTTIFSIERLLKICIYGCAGYFSGKERAWNVFETCLVLGDIVQLLVSGVVGLEINGASRLLRVIRLGRIAKIIRVLRLQIFKELMLMVNGIMGGAKTLMSSFTLILIPLYIVAMLLRETAGRLPRGKDDATENFIDLGTSLYTLFRCVVAGDCSDKGGRPIFLMLAIAHGWQYAAIYVVTVLLMSFGLFNVIVAIYIENTVAAAKFNDLTMKQNRLQNAEFFSNKAMELLELIHSMCHERAGISSAKIEDLFSGEITRPFFAELCDISRFSEILCELDVAQEDQMGLFDTLDVDGSGFLDVEELITGISQLRGDPRRADVISVGLTVRLMQSNFQKFETSVMQALELNDSKLDVICAAVANT